VHGDDGRLIVHDEGRVRVLTVSHPTKRNALSRATLGALADAVADPGPASGDGPRAFVLRGDPAGKAFSSGFDLTSINDEERSRGLDPIQPAAEAIKRCPVPVLAAAGGHVFGGAVELLISCHVKVGGRDLKVGVPPARLGLVYASGGLGRFVEALPPSQVLRLFLTGTPVAADEALRVGLFDLLADEPYEEALAMATQMAANAPLAVRGTLDAVRRLSASGLQGLTEADRNAMAAARNAALHSADLSEGVAAFVDKRPPAFEGR
jgi:enoyl-CoA hydratase/carnithine racemase